MFQQKFLVLAKSNESIFPLWLLPLLANFNKTFLEINEWSCGGLLIQPFNSFGLLYSFHYMLNFFLYMGLFLYSFLLNAILTQGTSPPSYTHRPFIFHFLRQCLAKLQRSRTWAPPASVSQITGIDYKHALPHLAQFVF